MLYQSFACFLFATLRWVKILTWQILGNFLLLRYLKSLIYNSVAELRLNIKAMVSSNILSLKSMLPSSFATKLALQATYVGIDFGTSTTVVSIASKENGIDSIKTLPIKLTQILEDGTIYKSEKLPSVIAWFNGKLLVGEGASNLKYTLTRGKNIWFSFKRTPKKAKNSKIEHLFWVSSGCGSRWL